MSRMSTLRRARRLNEGLPVTKKEKLRIAMLALTKIGLGVDDPKQLAISTLVVLGIKPKESEVESITEQQS